MLSKKHAAWKVIACHSLYIMWVVLQPFFMQAEEKIEVPLNCTWSAEASPAFVSKKAQDNSPELIKKTNKFGALIRDLIYYPLYWLSEDNKVAYEKLRYEKEYYQRFWSGADPQDSNLENAEIIKQNYLVRDQSIVICDYENKKIATVCRIIESKGSAGEEFLNIFIIPGSLSTLDNNLFAFYDFLLVHSKQKKERPIRLVIFGLYETSFKIDSKTEVYKPASFDALGEVVKRTLETLSEQYGKFSILYAHSAGCKALASLLRQSGAEIAPALLHFDRGASSMYEASRNYFFGKILYLIAKGSGLSLDIDQEIVSFYARCKKAGGDLQNSTCLITGVEEDVVYPGKSNLARSDCFEQMPKELNFAKLLFNPPEQIIDSRAHHSMRLLYLNNSYLSSAQGNIDMLPRENLVEALFRLSRQ